MFIFIPFLFLFSCILFYRNFIVIFTFILSLFYLTIYFDIHSYSYFIIISIVLSFYFYIYFILFLFYF